MRDMLWDLQQFVGCPPLPRNGSAPNYALYATATSSSVKARDLKAHSTELWLLKATFAEKYRKSSEGQRDYSGE